MNRICALTFPLLLLLVASAPAYALQGSASLTTEFDDGVVDDFGLVEITEDGFGGLLFHIQLSPTLGAQADLHRLYFNLLGNHSGLGIETSDPVRTLYTLQVEPRVAGGAGSSFDYGVNLGNGSGKKGNGVMQDVNFLLFADGALALGDLDLHSTTNQGVVASVAVHVQNTDYLGDSETVGGILETEESEVPPNDEDAVSCEDYQWWEDWPEECDDVLGE